MAKGDASKAKVPEKTQAKASTAGAEPETQEEQTRITPQPQAALIPGVNLEETLAQLVTTNQPTPNTQTTTAPTTQPSTEPIPQTPNPTKPPSHPETTSEPAKTVVEIEEAEEKQEDGGEPHADAEEQSEEVGKIEGVVEGEKITESEAVVDEEELQAAREREVKAKAGEEARYVEGIAEKVSENEGDEDRKSESREATEVLESEEDDEEGSVGVGEEQGGIDRAVDESVEGLGNVITESDTEVVSEGDYDRKEEEGEVVNRAEKKKEVSKKRKMDPKDQKDGPADSKRSQKKK